MELSDVEVLKAEGVHRLVLLTKERLLPIELVFKSPFIETITLDHSEAFVKSPSSSRLYITGGCGKGNTTVIAKIVSGSLSRPEKMTYRYSITHSDEHSEVYLEVDHTSVVKMLKVVREMLG